MAKNLQRSLYIIQENTDIPSLFLIFLLSKAFLHESMLYQHSEFQGGLRVQSQPRFPHILYSYKKSVYMHLSVFDCEFML